MIGEIMEAVLGMLNAIHPYAQVTLGTLPATDGICLACAGGEPTATFFNRAQVVALDVVINAKHTSGKLALTALCDIHRALTRAEHYPEGLQWQLLHISTASEPALLEIDPAGQQWLYGSAVTVTYYER
ncbi:MAG: hypothetical protein RR653_12990 [Clostridia bacterium]